MSLTRTTLDRSSEPGLSPRPTIMAMGVKAGQCLSTPGFSGEVISAGTRAAYIATNKGEILAVCRPDQQPHPRSFLTDMDLSMFHVGLRTWLEGNELCFSSGIALNLNGHKVWDRQPLEAGGATPIHRLRSRCEDLLQAALDILEGENLGLALSSFTEDGNAGYSRVLPHATSPLIAAGVERIRELLPHCRCGDLHSVLPIAEQLIGLGPGLTPSGDDFVGGLTFMAFHLNRAYPTGRWLEGGDIPALLARSESMTSRISHALLTDLAEGQSHDSLHDLVDSLFSDAGEFGSSEHVRRVAEIGHSSGWDMLTGMLAGLLPVIYRA